MKEFIEDMIQSFQQQALYKKSIHFHCEGSDSTFFYIDNEKFKQVLWNMFINSAQALKGEGDIFIQWYEIDAIQLLTIKDTGIGIAAENKGKIFDPFFTTKEGGTGLGLATTYKLIEAHGGHISVESEVGRGTTFTLSLPKKGGVHG